MWQDRGAMRQIAQMRDDFKLTQCVETGTWIGASAEVLAHHFPSVLTCEIAEGYFRKATNRLAHYKSIILMQMESDKFLHLINNEATYFFLDAHPFNNNTGGWPIEKEIPALGKRDNCVICIHDFDNGELGFISDGTRKLDWRMVGHLLTEVNPNFHYYTNTMEFCDIVSEEDIGNVPVTVDADIIDCIRHSINGGGDATKYRGILYAVPQPLDLSKYKLIEFYAKN